MDVVSGSQYELLNGVLLLPAHLGCQLILGLGDKKSPSAFGPVVFHYHRPVDIIRLLKSHGNIDPGPQ